MHDLANPAKSGKGNFSHYDGYLFITLKRSRPLMHDLVHNSFLALHWSISFTVVLMRKAKGATVIQINWPLALSLSPPPTPNTPSPTPRCLNVDSVDGYFELSPQWPRPLDKGTNLNGL